MSLLHTHYAIRVLVRRGGNVSRILKPSALCRCGTDSAISTSGGRNPGIYWLGVCMTSSTVPDVLMKKGASP
jgi:hypothetical protein